MSKIFICYRRHDCAWCASRIHDHLVAAFGRGSIFFDAVTIEPGADFEEVIGESVGSCRVLLAIIGRRWTRSIREVGDRPNDFVSVEIAQALRRGVRVIPVLVDGARLPRPRDLSADLAPLARRHAIALTASRCDVELGRLVDFLRLYLSRAEQSPSDVEAMHANDIIADLAIEPQTATKH